MSTIRVGSSGPDVQAWQKILAASPKPTTWVNDEKVTRSWPSTWAWPLIADGSFGKQTEWATEAWQAGHGILADGIVGQATWAKASEKASPLVIVRGTDMSAVQGVRPDSEWKALKSLGIGFTFLRAIVGNETWSDASAKANVERARAQDIKVGAYNFAYPLRHISPEKQAEDFVRRTNLLVGDLDLPLAVDLEWPVREQREKDGSISYPWKKWGCSPAQIQDWILKHLERGESLTGRRWIVYSFRYWLQCIEASKIPELASRPLWLADYGLSGKIPTPLQAYSVKGEKPWDKPTFVQHDGDGGLKLPSGTDVDYNFFLGSKEDLAAFCDLTIPVTATIDSDSTVVASNAFDDLLSDSEIAAYRDVLKAA